MVVGKHAYIHSAIIIQFFPIKVPNNVAQVKPLYRASEVIDLIRDRAKYIYSYPKQLTMVREQ